MDRSAQLQQWLESTLGHASFRLTGVSNDASFRRYFRVHFDDGRTTLVVMDAPPPQEDCRPYVHVAALFAAAGVHVPQIHAQNLAAGFLLLSDLGDTTYLKSLEESSADRLYGDALEALLCLQRASRPGALPQYDRELLRRELMLFPDWYCARQLGRELNAVQRQALEEVFGVLLENNLGQPKVYVHRDYHSRNLMLSQPNPGILDFQDAVYGPITYDLVSLLRDAYIAWPEERVLDWCARYWERARRAGLPVAADFAEFYRDFEWMGAQRQLKVLGIFARLCWRDGKDGYLRDQPLVMRYLRRTCERYRELMPLARLLDELEPQPKSVGYTF
ncbi:MAG: phosphotransferase [Betaproteobacteria bacterium]|nr:phosphotransferase [Betaproteobacteria bacterium]